jgi:hypothetical protein
MGRRMAETAALLVEHRLRDVLWRQWVLSFEGPMAVRLGYDRRLLGRECLRFAKRVMQTLRQQTKREHGLRSSSNLHPGVLVVVQRCCPPYSSIPGVCPIFCVCGDPAASDGQSALKV